jgi:hypothetical protein
VAVKNAIKLAKDFVDNKVQDKIQKEITMFSEGIERIRA